jgi:uroporphyrinogen-III synthase
MGPVTSATLRELGYDVKSEAANSTLDSLVETLLNLV